MKRAPNDHLGIRVCKEQCETCIFKPGNLMQLRPGRLKDHIDATLRIDGVALCHEVNFGARKYAGPGARAAICRGFFDRYDTTPLQLARRLEKLLDRPLIEYVDPTSTTH